MFKLNTLTCKNFMSVGNQTQAVDFDRRDLTLVLGENLDRAEAQALVVKICDVIGDSDIMLKEIKLS